MSARWTPTKSAHNGDVRLAFDRLPSEGEPLLLIMGLGVSRRWWPDGLCEAFAANGFAVARYDHRDAGESTHLPDTNTRNPFAALFGNRGEAYTAEDMTDDAVAVMDALDWESAHLFGHSLGGVIAQRVALRHPARVRTVTTSAALPSDVAGLKTLCYLRSRTLARLSRLKYPHTRQGHIDASVQLARLLSSPAYTFDATAARAWATREVDRGVIDARAQSRQIGARWRGPELSELRAPTLVLHGDSDPLIRPAAARRTAATVDGARLIGYPGVGHDLPEPLWTTVAGEVRCLANTVARHQRS